jgi:hypothetical protein
LASYTIDRFVFRRLNDPRARKFRHTVNAPLINSRCKRLLGRLFRHIEIAKLPN